VLVLPGLRDAVRAFRYRSRRPVPVEELDDRSGTVLVGGVVGGRTGPSKRR
jgi:hypothetical protein